MPMVIVCPNCRKKYSVSDSTIGKLAGKKVKCKKCETLFPLEGAPDDSEGLNLANLAEAVQRSPPNVPQFRSASDPPERNKLPPTAEVKSETATFVNLFKKSQCILALLGAVPLPSSVWFYSEFCSCC